MVQERGRQREVKRRNQDGEPDQNMEETGQHDHELLA